MSVARLAPSRRLRTQVAILGAGPAGLLLGQLLSRAGIDSVILEARSREYVEARVRAGVLEPSTVELISEAGAGERLLKRGLVRRGIEIRAGGQRHRIPVSDLTDGRSYMIYGQEELVGDLIQARVDRNEPLLFEAEAVGIHDLDSRRPTVEFVQAGATGLIECDFVAGCDGFHGLSRRSVPAGALKHFARDYHTAWLGILVEGPPSTDEPIWAHHERGFALCNVRSPTRSRMFVECAVDDDVARWPQQRVWEELHVRLETNDGWGLRDGEVREISPPIPMRSFVVEPMRHGRLYLAGDAAHIVPAIGAKGLNLAAADVALLAAALARFVGGGDSRLLDAYSQTCLTRIWRAQRFCSWAIATFHRLAARDGFAQRTQPSELERLFCSEGAATAFAEDFLGVNRHTRGAGNAAASPRWSPPLRTPMQIRTTGLRVADQPSRRALLDDR